MSGFNWATLAGAGVSTLGNLFGISSSSGLNKANRRWQSAEAEKAYQRQREFFQDFQSPSAVLNQYRDAGVNPNYVLQNGGVSSPSAPSVASANTPASFDVGSQLSRGSLQLGQMIQNSNLIRSQAGKNDAEANNINLKTPKELEKLGYDTDTAKEVARLAGANQEMDLQLKNQELSLKTAETATQQAMSNVYHWQALNSQFEFENLKPLEMQQIQASITKDLAQVDLMVAQKHLTEQEAKLAIANIYKTYMDAVSNRISANASQTSANAQMLNAKVNLAEMPSRIDMNYSTSELNTANAGKTNVETQGLKIDVDTKRKTQQFVIKSMQTSCEILGKQNSWFNTRQIGGMIKDVGVGIGSAIGGVASAATSIGKLGM